MTAHKNRGNETANNWQGSALFLCMVFMVVSLFLSRAALSVSIIVFAGLALVHQNTVQQVRRFLKTPYLLIFSFLFFIPFLSGLWSSNLDKWSDVVRIKLPLLVFPLASAGAWSLSKKQWSLLAMIFLLCVFGGCVWGLVDYLLHAEQINESYSRAKTILTPLEDDHVRFSWLVSVCCILCFLLTKDPGLSKYSVFFVLLTIFFVIYLHILSARTGLLSLYLFLLLYAGRLLFKMKERKWSVLLLSLLVIVPLISYFVLPTFKARIHYNLYDLSFVQKREYLPGSSDGARVMSINAGWQVVKENPLGVGAGDIMQEADKWYATNVPTVLPTDKIYPSSEWLIYGGFAGWPGIVLFTLIMLAPFITSMKKHRFYWIAFHATALFSFAIDMGLEVQYGVFLYAFISLWWCKWFNTTEAI